MPNQATINQWMEQLAANRDEVPLIGASLVPLVLRAQGIETVPCLQGGRIMPTLDRVSRLLNAGLF